MSTIPGIIGSALAQSPSVPTFSTSDHRTLDSILKKFDPATFSKNDFLQLSDDLETAGIAATTDVTALIQSQGFDLTAYLDPSADNDNDVFGPAVALDLSSPAQAVVDDSRSDAPKPGRPISGGVSYDSVSANVTRAKREVIPQIGVDGADEVVDSFGNIDYAKLQKLVALQVEKKAS